MAEETDSNDEPETAETVDNGRTAERTTAPMSQFGRRELAYGFAVLLIGIAITFVLPLLATTI